MIIFTWRSNSIGHFFLLWPEDRDTASNYLIITNPKLSAIIGNTLSKYCDEILDLLLSKI